MKLNKKGLEIRASFLKIAVESGDTAFLECLKDEQNLKQFNALCDMLTGGNENE